MLPYIGNAIPDRLQLYMQYQSMAFLGFNTADAIQLSKLITYVKSGGRLLLG